jgi:hypothetical protein
MYIEGAVERCRNIYTALSEGAATAWSVGDVEFRDRLFHVVYMWLCGVVSGIKTTMWVRLGGRICTVMGNCRDGALTAGLIVKMCCEDEENACEVRILMMDF